MHLCAVAGEETGRGANGAEGNPSIHPSIATIKKSGPNYTPRGEIQPIVHIFKWVVSFLKNREALSKVATRQGFSLFVGILKFIRNDTSESSAKSIGLLGEGGDPNPEDRDSNFTISTLKMQIATSTNYVSNWCADVSTEAHPSETYLLT